MIGGLFGALVCQIVINVCLICTTAAANRSVSKTDDVGNVAENMGFGVIIMQRGAIQCGVSCDFGIYTANIHRNHEL